MAKKKIVGSEFSDTLSTTSKSNKKTRIYGRGGDDYLTANTTGITSYLYGESGDDGITSNEYTKYVDGGDGNDRIIATVGSKQKVNGGSGDDTLNIDWTNYSKKNKITRSIVDTGSGDDILSYRYSDGNSSIKTSGTQIFMGAGNDKLSVFYLSYSDNTRFDMGDGDDIINFQGTIPTSPQSYFNGGAGTDTFLLEYINVYNADQFLRLEQVSPDTYNMVFSAWQMDGIGYEQKIQLTSVEKVSNGQNSIDISQLIGVTDLRSVVWE